MEIFTAIETLINQPDHLLVEKFKETRYFKTTLLFTNIQKVTELSYKE